MQTYRLQSLAKSTPFSSSPPAGASSNHRHPVGSAQQARHSIPPAYTRRLPAFGAVALLLIAMLGGIFFWPDSEPPELPAIPAAVVQPDAPAIEATTLVDISFPAGALGTNEHARLLFSEAVVAPEGQVHGLSLCLRDALYLFHVESGAMTVDFPQETQILRHGQSVWEPVPAGTAATVEPGDTLYYRTLERQSLAISNQGAQELRFLWVVWGGNEPACEPDDWPLGMTGLWGHPTEAGYVDPTQPMRLVIRALSANPGVTFPQHGPDALVIVTDEQRRLGGKQWISVRGGRLEYGSAPATPVSATPERTIEVDAGLILTEGTVFAPGADKRVVMMTAGDQPADLAVMNIYVGEPDATGGIAAP